MPRSAVISSPARSPSKTVYGLWVAAKEKAAMIDVLAHC